MNGIRIEGFPEVVVVGTKHKFKVVVEGVKTSDDPQYRFTIDGREPTIAPVENRRRSGGAAWHQLSSAEMQLEFEWTPESYAPKSKFAVTIEDSKHEKATTSVEFEMRPNIKEAAQAEAAVQAAARLGGRTFTDVIAAGAFPVTLKREPAVGGSEVDETLWAQIFATTRAIRFENYAEYLKTRLCDSTAAKDARSSPGGFVLSGTKAYDVLKEVTEEFMKHHCAVSSRSPAAQEAKAEMLRRFERLSYSHFRSDSTIPNVQSVEGDLARVTSNNDTYVRCFDSEWRRLCLVELIWSYWHEEGMLVQTMKAISRRFQNLRGPGTHDPLANLELDPLRPLGNVIWGYIQDEQNRLSVRRRAHEYEHEYGLGLEGSAVTGSRPADRRSKFLESFHNLLHECVRFYRQDDDKTVSADGFPVLNAIREMHFVIAYGAHNQFGDLPEIARQEMLLEQWILARPEMREFLRGRIMVPYPEPWMDRVDAMKSLQNWTDVSTLSFRDLAIFGEQILLSVRYGTWADQNDPATAVTWARFWRPEIQGYIHAYRTVTGVDLAADVTSPQEIADRYLPPSRHLARRVRGAEAT